MRARLLPDNHRVLAGTRRQVTDDGGFEVKLGLHLDQWSSKIENTVITPEHCSQSDAVQGCCRKRGESRDASASKQR